MDIVEELRSDREKGAKRLEAEYKAGLMSLARRFCVDSGDAEELVNRTFAEVVRGIDDYLEKSAFFGWMCQIMTNIHSMDCRKKMRRLETFPGDVPDVPDETSEGEAYRELDATLLHEAVEGLPSEQREAVVLHYFADMPVSKIARYLSIPTGTVLSRLHYARKALGAKLGVEVREIAKKPGVKALLLALALACTAALGAAVWGAGWGEPSRRAVASNASFVSPAMSGGDVNLSTPSPQQETIKMSSSTRSAALGAATALAFASAPSAASGDGYQFIVSGDPSAVATAGVVAAESGTGSLDARHHAVAESRTMALSSIKNGGFVIVVR